MHCIEFAVLLPLRGRARLSAPLQWRVRSAILPGNLQLPMALATRKGHAASVRRQSRQRLRSERRYIFLSRSSRRYSRNRSVRFYRHLERTGSAFPRLPRRFAPRNDTSGAFTIITIGCSDRQHCAGAGCPLPYNGVCGRRQYAQICCCQRRSLTAATDAIGFYVFNGSLYELQVPSRDCHGREAPSQ